MLQCNIPGSGHGVDDDGDDDNDGGGVGDVGSFVKGEQGLSEAFCAALFTVPQRLQ
jgi:hypothetical protein